MVATYAKYLMSNSVTIGLATRVHTATQVAKHIAHLERSTPAPSKMKSFKSFMSSTPKSAVPGHSEELRISKNIHKALLDGEVVEVPKHLHDKFMSHA